MKLRNHLSKLIDSIMSRQLFWKVANWTRVLLLRLVKATKDRYSNWRRIDYLAETLTKNDNSESQMATQRLLTQEGVTIQKYRPSSEGSLRQGEILTNLKQFKLNIESLRSAKPLVEPIIHPFAIVITQDCDCEQDFKPRIEGIISTATVPSILFCEVVEAESLRNRDKGKSKIDITSEVWKQVKNNKNERYHFLETIPKTADLLVEGLPELALDFKRYFTIPTEEVYYRIEIEEAKRRSRLVSPYLEHLTSRFNYFQSRIALPEDHTSI